MSASDTQATGTEDHVHEKQDIAGDDEQSDQRDENPGSESGAEENQQAAREAESSSQRVFNRNSADSLLEAGSTANNTRYDGCLVIETHWWRSLTTITLESNGLLESVEDTELAPEEIHLLPHLHYARYGVVWLIGDGKTRPVPELFNTDIPDTPSDDRSPFTSNPLDGIGAYQRAHNHRLYGFEERKWKSYEDLHGVYHENDEASD